MPEIFKENYEETPEITEEAYITSKSVKESMERDNLVEPGFKVYQEHCRIIGEYERKHPEILIKNT